MPKKNTKCTVALHKWKTTIHFVTDFFIIFLPVYLSFFFPLSFILPDIFSLQFFFLLLSLSSPFSPSFLCSLSILHSKKEKNSLGRTQRGLGLTERCRFGLGCARRGLGWRSPHRSGCGFAHCGPRCHSSLIHFLGKTLILF